MIIASQTQCVWNVKALVGALNQEKALVGAFSVIVKTNYGTDWSFYSTSPQRLLRGHSAQFNFLVNELLWL